MSAVWWNHYWVKKSQACIFVSTSAYKKNSTCFSMSSRSIQKQKSSSFDKLLPLRERSSIYCKRCVYIWKMEDNLEHWEKKWHFFCLIQCPGILNSTLWYLTNLQGTCSLEKSVWILYKRQSNIWILFPILPQLTFTEV